MAINQACRNWGEKAIETLASREKYGEYLIVPNYSECRTCGKKNRFVYAFGTMSDGRYMCMRVCTYCGDSIHQKKFRITHKEWSPTSRDYDEIQVEQDNEQITMYELP